MNRGQDKKCGKSKARYLECKSILKVYTVVSAAYCKRIERENKGKKILAKNIICVRISYTDDATDTGLKKGFPKVRQSVSSGWDKG